MHFVVGRYFHSSLSASLSSPPLPLVLLGRTHFLSTTTAALLLCSRFVHGSSSSSREPTISTSSEECALRQSSIYPPSRSPNPSHNKHLCFPHNNNQHRSLPSSLVSGLQLRRSYSAIPRMEPILDPLPREVYTSACVKKFEPISASNVGTTMYALMESAGLGVWEVIQRKFPEAKRILVVSGKGGNGGDGYIVARYALQAGILGQLVQMGNPKDLAGDAAMARDKYLEGKGVISPPEGADFENCDLIVDAMLGIGLSGNVREEYARVIQKVNTAGKPVVAIDLPSGLCSDTGNILGVCVEADVTVTMVALKQGLFTGFAADFVGELYYTGVGVGEEFRRIASTGLRPLFRSQRSSFSKLWLGPRKKTAHKGDFGRLLLLGGGRNMPGAIRLAGEAALRTGTGLVKVLTHPDNTVAVSSGRPELMVVPYHEGDDISDLFEWATTLVVGPGLGTDSWSLSLLNAFLKHGEKPSVLDADALNLLQSLGVKRSSWVLTPHPGEAARLLGRTTKAVGANRFETASALQDQYGGVVLLKGAGTVICSADECHVVNVGNPGMASGGMGDTLTGIIGGLLAQKVPLLEATVLGACIHGDAADLAVQDGGQRGLIASDLLPHIRALVNIQEE